MYTLNELRKLWKVLYILYLQCIQLMFPPKDGVKYKSLANRLQRYDSFQFFISAYTTVVQALELRNHFRNNIFVIIRYKTGHFANEICRKFYISIFQNSIFSQYILYTNHMIKIYYVS